MFSKLHHYVISAFAYADFFSITADEIVTNKFSFDLCGKPMIVLNDIEFYGYICVNFTSLEYLKLKILAN